jgi:hypothetical protein
MPERLPGIKSDGPDEDQQIMEFAMFMSLTAGWRVLRIPAMSQKPAGSIQQTRRGSEE